MQIAEVNLNHGMMLVAALLAGRVIDIS